MQAPLLHMVNGHRFWLSAARTVFWEETKTLVLSDMHLGKTGHFRKEGIPVPQKIVTEDLHRLTEIISFHKVKRLLVVGDMFHSHHNKELDRFLKWRNDFNQLRIELVKGNHDILQADWYRSANIHVHKTQFFEEGFCFTHEALESVSNQFVFSGHIHPGIKIPGLAKQTLSFPCFYFTPSSCILPAYGHFTGHINMSKLNGADTIYAIVNQTLIKI